MVEEGRERKRTDGRTDESELRRLPRRNIKLNKRSIFCSLFLTGVELRHFATLFSLRPLAGLPSSLLPPSRAAPARACTLFLPLADFLLHHPLFLLLLLLLLLFAPPPVPLFRSSRLPLSLSGLCVETSRAEERHSIKVEYVRLGLFFTLGGVQIVKSILPPKFRMPPPTPAQRARGLFRFFPRPSFPSTER